MKNNSKVSLVITVKNEENCIEKLLESIANQTLSPDEIIIADAGSTDRTKEQIKHFKTKLPQLKLIDVSNSNRSKGRNAAITKAKNDIIAVTDAGCSLKNDWIEKITNPLARKEGDAVAGFYITSDETMLEKCSAPFLATMPDKLVVDEYLPSSRSVAFTKKSWEKAGKYPEHVDFCEDLVFAKNLKEKADLVVQPTAIVYWNHYRSLGHFFRQIKNYAYGDVEARYTPHTKKIITVFARYMLFLIAPWLLFFYPLWPIKKHYHYIKNPAGLFYLPLFQFLTDIGIMAGSLKAIL